MTNSQRNKTKITVTLKHDVLKEFDGMISEAGLRRDNYLNMVLPGEVEELAKVTANSVKGQRFIRNVRSHDKDSLAKVSFSLDAELVQVMNTVCSDKRVPRNLFLENFLEFLVYGADNGSCASPLAKALALIGNPRFEYCYYEEEKSAYSHLTMTDEEVDRKRMEVDALFKQLMRSDSK